MNNRLAGLLGQSSQETGINALDIELIKKTRPSKYVVFNLDLSIARTRQVFDNCGDFLQVLTISQGASFDIAFDVGNNDYITIDAEVHFFHPYDKFYITNTAQAGASAKLYLGLGSYYVPFYRTKAIPPNIDTIQQYVTNINTTAVALSSPANKNVVRIDIYNNSADTMYIGNSAVTTADGLPLFAGQDKTLTFYPFYLSAGIYVIKAGTTRALNYLVYGSEL